MAELFRALAALSEPPVAATDRVAALLGLPAAPDGEAYTTLFVLEMHPYASVYLGAEGMLGGEARDRIAGFWRAIGRVPPPEPDHLATMLALYATLVEHEDQHGGDTQEREALRRVRASFFWEHLASWLPPYLAKLSGVAPPPYDQWGAMLRAAIEAEATALGPPAVLPLHLRRAPPLPPSPRAAELVDALAAPVVCGLLLTRGDLRRAAADLGLGLRAGERRFVLRALLQQEPSAVGQWLETEAAAWASRLAAATEPYGDVSGYWVSRARATASTLRESMRHAALR